MEKITQGHHGSLSLDMVQDNISKLKQLFPELITEDASGAKIDVDVLNELVGHQVIDGDKERYNFTWHGKAAARRLAQTPSTGTLRPCKEESKDWDTTQNLFIEGDNLEVLKLLQKSYHKKVKMIYIDPPYNTGKEFIYPDKYQDNLGVYLRYTGQINDEGFKVSANTENSGRYHTNWLNMMYPRLKLARNLLTNNGVIFISIDDNEYVNLVNMCNEIFGEGNLIATFIWKKKAGGGDDSGHVAIEHEYVICYGKYASEVELANIEHESPSMTAKYNREENGRRYYLERLDKTSLTYSKSMDFEIECPDGTLISPPQPSPSNPTSAWRWGKDTVKERRGELEFHKDKKTGEWRVYTRTWESLDGVTPRSLLVEQKHGRNREGTRELSSLIGPKIFNNPKPTKFLMHLVSIGASKDNDIILDFFSGSGSLSHAVQLKNVEDGMSRKFISVQLPEKTNRTDYATIADIGKERIRRVSEKIRNETPSCNGDLGFKVFKLDSSNIKPWDADFDNLEDMIAAADDSLKKDRTADDVLYEILLKYGLDLTLPIEEHILAGKTVHNIGCGALMICLDDEITLDVVNAIGDLKKELQPEVMRVVFKDAGFADPVVKTNAIQVLKQFGIDDVKSI